MIDALWISFNIYASLDFLYHWRRWYMTFERRGREFVVWGIYKLICCWLHVYYNAFVLVFKLVSRWSTIRFSRMVFIMGGTTELKVIGKYEELFLSLYITSLSVPHPQAFFSYHGGDNCDHSCWVVYQILHYLCGLLYWCNKYSVGDFIHQESSSIIVSKMGPCYYCFHHWFYCHFHHFCYCCLTESASVSLVSAFVAFAAPVEVRFVWTGWFHSMF